MNDSPDVALYIPALDAGGAQRITINVANGLAKRGYAVELVLSYDRGEFRDRVDDGVRVVDLETPRVPGIGVGAGVIRLARYLEDAHPEVLIAAMTHVNVVAVLATRLSQARPATVIIEHERFDLDRGGKDALVRSLAKRVYGGADRVVGVSEGVARSVVEGAAVDDSGVDVLYNPVNLATVRQRSNADVGHPWLTAKDYSVVFTAARLEPAKDLPTLLEAFASVHERRPETRLIVAGDGSERAALVSLSERLGIRDVVSFPGYEDNPYAYMRQADAFALSSKHEGLPTVLIEALACGCPVVSTDCPSGPREILGDRTYGSLVPVGDAEAFADALVATLDAPPDSDRLRERAGEFSMDAAIREYVELIESERKAPG
jgi:glycosyltransferase involved in cell wall biosynthesis